MVWSIYSNCTKFTIHKRLFGDALDFEELYKDLYDKLLYHEAYWNAYNDDCNNKLYNENQRLKKKISELEKSNK